MDEPRVIFLWAGTREGAKGLMDLISDEIERHRPQDHIILIPGLGVGGWIERAFGSAFGYGAKARLLQAETALRAYEGLEVLSIGASRGGWLATVHALRAERAGHEIDRVILLDPVSQWGLPWVGSDQLDAETVSSACVTVIRAMRESRRLFPGMRLDGRRFKHPVKRYWLNGDHGYVCGVSAYRERSLSWQMCREIARGNEVQAISELFDVSQIHKRRRPKSRSHAWLLSGLRRP